MRRAILSLAAVALLLSLSSCNMSRHRYDITVNGPASDAELQVWVNDPDGFTQHHLWFDTVLFPIDALWSLGASTVAMFDDRWENKYGPLGTFLALFPAITTVNTTGPGTKRWDGFNPPKIDFSGTLDAERFNALMNSVDLGKGPPALQRLSNEGFLHAGPASDPKQVDRLNRVR